MSQEPVSSHAKAHAFTAKWEGGLSDVPQDSGGITKYGVSLAFLQDIATHQRGRDVLDRMGVRLPVTADSVRQLTPEHAASLFRWELWTPMRLESLPQRVATLLYDMAVNHGAQRAVILAQRGFNACVGPYGVKLHVDGMLGPMTRAALAQNTDCIIRGAINARRAFYNAIVDNNSSQSVFLRGWLNRCDALARELGVA